MVERQDQSVVGLGLTLAEGRAPLAEVQSVLVSHQTESWMADHRACCRCGAVLAHKDSRSIMMRTVFGKVEIASLRLWECSCGARRGEARRSVSPLSKAIAQRVSPELEYLQAKWAALLPFRQARVNIVAGRATFTDRTPRLYAYIHKQVPSAADRLDQFLHTSEVGPSERVTVISDDAGEFDRAMKCSELARGRLIDWFHIAIKF